MISFPNSEATRRFLCECRKIFCTEYLQTVFLIPTIRSPKNGLIFACFAVLLRRVFSDLTSTELSHPVLFLPNFQNNQKHNRNRPQENTEYLKEHLAHYEYNKIVIFCQVKSFIGEFFLLEVSEI